MSELTDFIADNTGPSTVAGIIKHTVGVEALAENDLVVFGPDGKAYPAQSTDYVAVADQSTVVLAETVVAAQKVTTGAQRQPMCVGQSGEVFVAAPNAGSTNGLTIYRYASTGTLLSARQVSAVVNVATSPKLLQLSNGNLAVTYIHAGDLRLAVYDSALRLVMASASIATLYASNGYDAIALTGGGLMMTWQPGATPQSQKLAVYDNAGAVVTAAATVQTWSGSAGYVMPRLHQISNGNVVLAATSGYTTTVGLFHAVFTAAGVNVVAFANLSTVSVGQTTPLPVQIGSCAGFYAITRPDGVNLVAYVLSNAGALQGAPFTWPDVTYDFWVTKIVSDGQQLWLLHMTYPAFTFWNLTTLPTTGTQYVTTQVTTSSGAGNASCIDASFTRGRIVAIHSASSAGSAMRWSVIDPAVPRVEKDVTVYGTSTGTAPKLVIGDDCTVVAAQDSTVVTSLIAFKWANIAVAGVASAAFAPGQLATLQPGPGAFHINTLRGSVTKQFDHTTGTNIRANKGTVSTNGVVLKGM